MDLQRPAARLNLAETDVSAGLVVDVLTTVLQSAGGISRSDIARRLGLKQSSVSKAVRLLLESGYLKEGKKERLAQGRPMTLLEAADRFLVVGLCLTDVEHPKSDVAQSRLVGVLMSLDGKILHTGQASVKVAHNASAADRAANVARETTEFVKNYLVPKLADAQLLAVGLSLGGQISDGMVIRSHNLGWDYQDPVPLQRYLREEFAPEVAVKVDNEANALTDHMHWFGDWTEWLATGRRPSTFLTLLLTQDGVGGGLYLNGDRYSAASGITGEIGHVTFNRQPDAPMCRCTRRGCVEAYAAPSRMLEAIRDPEAETKWDLAAAARSDLEEIGHVFGRGGRALGAGLAAAVNIVGPEAIVVCAPEELIEHRKLADQSSEDESLARIAGARYWAGFKMAMNSEVFPGGEEIPIAYVPLPAGYERLAAAAATTALGAVISELRSQGGT